MVGRDARPTTKDGGRRGMGKGTFPAETQLKEQLAGLVAVFLVLVPVTVLVHSTHPQRQ
jgi:hypothetical protein